MYVIKQKCFRTHVHVTGQMCHQVSDTTDIVEDKWHMSTLTYFNVISLKRSFKKKIEFRTLFTIF